MDPSRIIAAIFCDRPGVIYENPPSPNDDFENFEPIFFTLAKPQSIPGVTFIEIDRSLIHKSLLGSEEKEDKQTSTESTGGDENRKGIENIEGTKAVRNVELRPEVLVNESTVEKGIGKSKISKENLVKNGAFEKTKIRRATSQKNESAVLSEKNREGKQNDQSKEEKKNNVNSDNSKNDKKKKSVVNKSSALQSISKSYSMSESDSDGSEKHKTKSSSHQAISHSKKLSGHRKKDKDSRNDTSCTDVIPYDKVGARRVEEFSVKQEIASSDDESLSTSFSKKVEITVKQEVLFDKDDYKQDKSSTSNKKKMADSKRHDDSKSRNDCKDHDDSRRHGDSRRHDDSRRRDDSKKHNDCRVPDECRRRDDSKNRNDGRVRDESRRRDHSNNRNDGRVHDESRRRDDSKNYNDGRVQDESRRCDDSRKKDDSKNRNNCKDLDHSKSCNDSQNHDASRKHEDSKNRFEDSQSHNDTKNHEDSQSCGDTQSHDDSKNKCAESTKNHGDFPSADDSRNRPNDDSNGGSRIINSYMQREMKQEPGSANCIGPNDFYCDVCKLILNSETTFSSHMAGKRHKKALRQVSEQEVAKSSVLEITESQIFPRPPDMDRIELYDEESIIQRTCEDAELLIVGLDYVREIRGYDDTKYFCDLCSAQCVANSIIKHLIGFKHQMNCLKKYCFRSYDWVKDLEKRDKRVDREIKLQLEEAKRLHGKGRIRVFRDVKRNQRSPEPYNPYQPSIYNPCVPSTSRPVLLPGDVQGKNADELTVTDEDCLSRDFSDFYCKVCDSHMNNYSMWESHARGKRHAKNKKKAPVGLVTNSNFVEAPRGTISHLEDMILESCGPNDIIVGLNFIRENQGENGDLYNCYLCGSVCPTIDIVDHLYLKKHKTKYLEKMLSDGIKNAINEISCLPIGETSREGLIDDECEKMMIEFGRGKPVICVTKKNFLRRKL